MEEYWRARSSALPVSSASMRQQGLAWDCASFSRPPWTEGQSAHGRALTTNGKSSDSNGHYMKRQWSNIKNLVAALLAGLSIVYVFALSSGAMAQAPQGAPPPAAEGK